MTCRSRENVLIASQLQVELERIVKFGELGGGHPADPT